jgi:hypothetical protein
MSLKAVHLFFVGAFSALCFGCGAWKWRDYVQDHGTKRDLVFGAASVLLGVAVLVYGGYFLKKLKTLKSL